MLVNKKILYIAYHFPPILGSSGVHRTLAFVRHLANNKWDTTVLTASLKGYSHWEEEQQKFIPENVNVIRAFCRNAAKHLSFKGKYFSWMALPDNWQSWILGGFFSGLKSIYQNRPSVIVSTYPIASAHVIAYWLHKVTGIPWVADFRDPMAQEDYPTEKRKKKIFEWIEKKAVKHCKNIVLTAPGAVEFYQNKFPHVDKNFWRLVPNGFDEQIFSGVMASNEQSSEDNVQSQVITLLHSGVIYPSERDPSDLFQAIAELKQDKKIKQGNFKLILRAAGHDELFKEKLTSLSIADVVILAPPIPYKEALQEMLSADGLLLLQADNCDYQIPAKAYEYIRAQKPVLALTSMTGDTGKLLKSAGISCITPLNNKEKIKSALIVYLNKIIEGSFNFLSEEESYKFSRQYHAKTFEKILLSAIE
ncbi:MAG: hypothetical protein OQK03_00385 [Colwellia sp.]|nr:hypothetical protein [Colwellia sp.]